jgi:hypothetical protein
MKAKTRKATNKTNRLRKLRKIKLFHLLTQLTEEQSMEFAVEQILALHDKEIDRAIRAAIKLAPPDGEATEEDIKQISYILRYEIGTI